MSWSKEGLAERVEQLNLNPDALQKIIIQDPETWAQIAELEGDTVKKSLQIFAAITTNESYIDRDWATRGLQIYGDELIEETRANPGKHPSIDILLDIVDSGKKVQSLIVRKYQAKPIPERLRENIDAIIATYGTPFHIYDEQAIRENARRLTKAFSWNPGFKEDFAVKACPNPAIMKILKQEWFWADCSSLPELLLSEKVGIVGEHIMFTSNNTPAQEFVKARELGAIINLDDITHIDFLERTASIPDLICFRYNPGPERTGNAIIGDPKEAKYGLTKAQLFEAYTIMKNKWVKRFGIHTMVASNELNGAYIIETARMLFSLVREISEKCGIVFEFANIGGGIGTPYKPEQKPMDIEVVSRGIQTLYEEMIIGQGIPPLSLYMECGRMVTGPYGYLVTKAVHKKDIYKQYVWVDACMADLMRPALYGAYHDMTVVWKEEILPSKMYDITGSLCENNDKFAVNRYLPEIISGDTVVIHNAGAHGHAMGFNYNGKLRSRELLLREDNSVLEIRRPETIDDYFATLDFETLGEV